MISLDVIHRTPVQVKAALMISSPAASRSSAVNGIRTFIRHRRLVGFPSR